MDIRQAQKKHIEWLSIDASQQIREDLQVFGANARDFYSRYSELLKEYPRQWVGFHEGKVRVVGPSLDEVLQHADAAGLRRQRVYIQYVDPDPVITIL